ncbi:MAG: hypothetical protein JNK05_15310 [Myxococcales bacterium]|nr:hypothetical protein [Myxococcales bacterium]
MNFRSVRSLLVAGLFALVACNGGPEGLVRWSARRCVATDASADDGGDASAEACERAVHRAVNTALPMPRPDPRVFSCRSRVSGEGATRTFEVAFKATDPNGATLELGGAGGGGTAPSALGANATTCTVTLREGAAVATGECGAQCTVTVTGYAEASRTISGRISCVGMGESDPAPRWQIRNAEGVPGMAADFSAANCSGL